MTIPNLWVIYLFFICLYSSLVIRTCSSPYVPSTVSPSDKVLPTMKIFLIQGIHPDVIVRTNSRASIASIIYCSIISNTHTYTDTHIFLGQVEKGESWKSGGENSPFSNITCTAIILYFCPATIIFFSDCRWLECTSIWNWLLMCPYLNLSCFALRMN